ncbi:hypothetical protein GGI07_003539 [Coemansia sp. Benny D115]|nr:hypothetical protein GGI07_003539 [Coemansia sp. Benny D115]
MLKGWRKPSFLKHKRNPELIPVFIPILLKLTTLYVHHKRSAIRHALKASASVSRANSGNHIPHQFDPPVWQGYVLVFGMFAMLVVYSWSFQWFYFEIGKAMLIARTALVSAVYRKTLVLSSQARTRLTQGRLTNLISSDMGQIERGITNMLVCITIPIQVVASIAVLIYMIGPTGIIGWALVVSFVPVQMWASRYLVRLRGRAVKYTDKRILATREAIQGMRAVKYFAWESSILETIKRIRSKEASLIARLNLLRYSLISFALHSPVFASILTFAVYTLAGGKLKTGPIFAVIGIFSSMSVPLSWFPGALAETRNSVVPLQRIAEALLEEELDQPHRIYRGLDVAVRVSNGCFSWSSDIASTNDSGGCQFAAKEVASMPTTSDLNVKSKEGLPSNHAKLHDYRFPTNLQATSIDGKANAFALAGLNIEIPYGCLVAVVGSVGSGKSSFVNALIGEMKCVLGEVCLGGSICYASQVPWIMSSTIRENITFGLPFDEEKYEDVIEACALDIDFQALPAGDLTEIGERGVTLSGGQKQRVSIARAAYADSDILLLDDCLSAVDPQVSRTIFRHCIKGFLASKTRILVTNDLELLPAFDFVIALDHGRIIEHGSFSSLMALGGVVASMANAYYGSRPSNAGEAPMFNYTTDSSLHTASPIKEQNEDAPVYMAGSRVDEDNIDTVDRICEADSRVFSELVSLRTEIGSSASEYGSSASKSIYKQKGKATKSNSSGNSSGNSSLAAKTSHAQGTGRMGAKTVDVGKHSSNCELGASKIMSNEERQTGQVSLTTYSAYIRAGGGYYLLGAVVLCLAISQGCRVGSDFWIRQWIRHRQNSNATHTYIWVYALLGGMQFVWFVVFTGLLVLMVFISSKRLHEKALSRVVQSPISFFDTTPMGRILNRFTRDIDSLDLALCDFFRQFYQNISRSVGAFVSISILVPLFLVPLVPLFSLSWVLIYVYLRTSVEVQRVASISRSPLYAHYSESLQGLATIRSFHTQKRYSRKMEVLLDRANRPQWYTLVVQNWVWLRVDYLSHLLSLLVCLIIISRPAKWDAAAVGLLLVQTTQMGAYVTYAGRGWTELQNNMNSVERINHYATALEQEPCIEAMETSVAPGRSNVWPKRGTVILRGLSMRYRSGLPLALDGIDMEVYSGERVGIVGRSGAGKSSIIYALFRLVEPSAGRIYIDGIDTQELPLRRLRRAIGILPQDPVLFDGTVRTNLDPLYEHSDTDIWDVLEQVRLRRFVSAQPDRLEMPVGEGGECFSVGQRQLLCLARVLLRRPKILVLDEATANVDHETDAAIQRAVLSRSRDVTVISIAHRLQTISGYDKVFVIDSGRVVGSGPPSAFLERPLSSPLCDDRDAPVA